MSNHLGFFVYGSVLYAITYLLENVIELIAHSDTSLVEIAGRPDRNRHSWMQLFFKSILKGCNSDKSFKLCLVMWAELMKLKFSVVCRPSSVLQLFYSLLSIFLSNFSCCLPWIIPQVFFFYFARHLFFVFINMWPYGSNIQNASPSSNHFLIF